MIGRFLVAALLAQPLLAVPTAIHEPSTDCPADPPLPPSPPPGGPGGPGGLPGGPGGPAYPTKPKPWGFFTNNTIYQTTGSEAATYPRYAELEDDTILATTSLIGHTPGYFPVFESKDGGASWDYISNITDQVNGWGMSAQPAITELTEDMGGYKKGTILAGGNSWSNNGTRIDLYASTDRGRSWEFVSHVASGGRPNTTNGADPIWEPYFMLVISPDTFTPHTSIRLIQAATNNAIRKQDLRPPASLLLL